jgi:hypothetical protein
MLNLEGVLSNKSAIGTIVKLKAEISGNPVWQMRKVAGQNGYCGQNLQIHFGLGDATQIDSLVIQWPSGIIQNVEGLNINDYNIVVEDTNTVSVNNESGQSQMGFHLYQNYPNPFNPSTTISWQSPMDSKQVLKVFDVLGNEIITLVDEEKEFGYYEINFNSVGLPSGIYFYSLNAGAFHETKKMILLR